MAGGLGGSFREDYFGGVDGSSHVLAGVGAGCLSGDGMLQPPPFSAIVPDMLYHHHHHHHHFFPLRVLYPTNCGPSVRTMRFEKNCQ